MKLSMKLAAVVLMLCMVGVADAGGKKTKSGLKGKIVSVADGTLTISTGKKSNGSTVTVKTDSSTMVTIDGVTGKKVCDLIAGEKVTVDPASGTATSITATSKHKHKKSTKSA